MHLRAESSTTPSSIRATRIAHVSYRFQGWALCEADTFALPTAKVKLEDKSQGRRRESSLETAMEEDSRSTKAAYVQETLNTTNLSCLQRTCVYRTTP